MTPPSGISRASPSEPFALIPFDRDPVEDVARVLSKSLLYIFQMNIFEFLLRCKSFCVQVLENPYFYLGFIFYK